MKFLSRKRKTFELRPEEYVKGYEDDDHPCSGCIVRPVCTEWCSDLGEYTNILNQAGNKLAKKWIPEKVKMAISSVGDNVIYSNDNMLRYFKETKGKKAAEIYNNDEAYNFLKKIQYHCDRTSSIWKNHTNKYGYPESSSAASGRSSSSTCPVSKVRTGPTFPHAYQSPMKTNQVIAPNKKISRLKIP